MFTEAEESTMRPYEPGILEKSQIYFCSFREDSRKIFFYPLCVGHYYCDSSYIVNRQNYNSYLVLYVMQGSIYVRISGVKKVINQGEFALIDCYQPHCYGSDTGCEILWVHYDGPQGRQYYDYMTRSGTINPPANPETCYRYMTRLMEVYEKNKITSEALISKYMIGILTEFMVGRSEVGEPIAAKLEHVRLYIDDNLRDPLSLEDLADEAGLSVYYFSRQFRQRFGCTPHDYVVRARLNMARFYLKTSSISVKDIAYRCGFTDECNFCTCFKKRCGCTPAQFRSRAGMILAEGF